MEEPRFRIHIPMTAQVTFEMNHKSYATDAETLSVLSQAVHAAKASNDYSAVCAVMALGLKTKRIVELD